MQIKKYIKEIFVTFLLIWFTGVWYAALSTVNSWDSLTATLWNDLVSLVNQNEANIVANTNSISNNTSKLSGISNVWGNIGIWRPSPASKLDIAWDISINGNPLSKIFYIRSSTTSVKCVSVNYAPTWYTDDDCIWLLNWYAYYESKTQDTFTVYDNSSCTSVYSSRWIMETKYMDQTNTNVYIKVPVLNWFYNELFCQKWLKQEIINY